MIWIEAARGRRAGIVKIRPALILQPVIFKLKAAAELKSAAVCLNTSAVMGHRSPRHQPCVKVGFLSGGQRGAAGKDDQRPQGADPKSVFAIVRADTEDT